MVGSSSTSLDGSSSRTSSEEVSQPLPAVSLFENSLQITIHKLNGKNYFEWSQSVRLVIDGKGKLGYLNGEELDLFEDEQWENSNDSARYKKKVERGRVFVFLASLNKELDEDLTSGKMIGGAKMGGGLYFFNNGSTYGRQDLQTCFNSISVVNDSLVYSKEHLAQKRATIPQHYQESDQRLDHEVCDDSSKIPINNPPCNYESNSSRQLDLPIALRKGISVVIPKSVYEALNVPEWKEAMLEEMRALEKNATWEKVDMPDGKTTVGCKWVFTMKYNSDGSLERYKARLVAKAGCEECFFEWGLRGGSLYGNLEPSQGYDQGQSDHTLFTKRSIEDKIYVLIVYVDDIILTRDDIVEMSRLKQNLAKEFEIKDLGQLKYFLGMEVARSKKGIVVSQRKYILDLLKETGMSGCKPSDTPIEANSKLGEVKNGFPVDNGRYQRLVGRLIYLSHTRPDIAFAVNMRGIDMYTDADWAGSVTDKKSTSGYCTFLWGNLVTWRRKKQNVVARSSAEAEVRAMAQGVCEILWLKRVLEELKRPVSLSMKFYCDNKAAISIAHNPVLHDMTKHVEIDRHFITEKLKE
ncbi:protein kinase domain-containing protein [Citrus sinensis]|uniref:Protein kinase domain-containing protein n=1 Tax=Citrus sinensis TaxID=2711 RepID=A0ACB8IQD1_CITSI|nr:protein kinase domain-containing protein [Citrus sinensis]